MKSREVSIPQGEMGVHLKHMYPFKRLMHKILLIATQLGLQQRKGRVARVLKENLRFVALGRELSDG